MPGRGLPRTALLAVAGTGCLLPFWGTASAGTHAQGVRPLQLADQATVHPSAVITSPRARQGAKYASVQFKQPIVVTYKNLPNSQVLWVLVRTQDGLVFPQLTCPKNGIGNSVVVRGVGQSSGVWSGTLYLGAGPNTGHGQLFTISLAIAGTQANNALIEATRSWCGTVGWPGLSEQKLPLDLKLLTPVVHAKRV